MTRERFAAVAEAHGGCHCVVRNSTGGNIAIWMTDSSAESSYSSTAACSVDEGRGGLRSGHVEDELPSRFRRIFPLDKWTLSTI